MSTLTILMLSFSALWLLNKYVLRGHFTISTMGRVAMAIMLLFTGASHFYKTAEMVQMLPSFMHYKTELIYATGIFEILAGVGLIYPQTSPWASFSLIVFFILVLPANIIGALKKVELGGMENGPGYLYFRIPLQILFIWWTYYFGIRLVRPAPKKSSESFSHA